MGMDRVIEKKKWIKRPITWMIAGGFVLVVTGLVLFTGAGSSTTKVKSGHITLYQVERGGFREYISLNGTVIPINTIYIDAVEGGRVENIYREAGSIVEKGDDLLKLSNTHLLMTVISNEAMVNRAENDLRMMLMQMEQSQFHFKSELARIKFETNMESSKINRFRPLFENEYMAEHIFEGREIYHKYLLRWRELTEQSMKNDLKLRREQIKQLERSVTGMKKNLELVKKQLENLVIKAPVSGLLTSLSAEIGQSKAPRERLGQIDIMDGFKIRAEIDEHFISRVEVGKVAGFDWSGTTYSMKVKKVYPEVKEGKFEVDLEFSGAQPADIKRGQTLNMELQLSSETETVLLARGGFFYTTGGRWIFVLDETTGIAVKREIKLGRKNPRYFEVLQGLKPGEKVITSTYENIGRSERLKIEN